MQWHRLPYQYRFNISLRLQSRSLRRPFIRRLQHDEGTLQLLPPELPSSSAVLLRHAYEGDHRRRVQHLQGLEDGAHPLEEGPRVGGSGEDTESVS